MRRTWEKRRRMARVMKRMMKKMNLMGQQGREQLRMMTMMKRMNLKPRNRRQISKVCSGCSVWRTTPSRDRQFSSKPSTPQSSLLNENTFKKRICLYFYLHFIFLYIL